MDEKLLFKIGSKIDICGSSGSGKTYWLSHYLMEVDNRFDKIVWITNELSAEQQLIKDMKKYFGSEKFEVNIGIENEQELKDKFLDLHEDKKKVACIFDDLMMSQNSFMTEMFLAGRHLDLTIFQLVQSIFVGGKNSRNLTNNVQYLILFQFPDALSVCEKARRLTTNLQDRDSVVQAWKEATSKKGGCLIMDFITGQSGLQDANLLKYRHTTMDCVFPTLAVV
jgi:ABC-type phosphate/phosphonate transport system ATPase subunit